MHADIVQENHEDNLEESTAALVDWFIAEREASRKRKREEKEEKKELKRKLRKQQRKKHRRLMKEVRAHRRSKGLEAIHEPPSEEEEVEDEELETYDYDQLHLAFKDKDM